MEGAVNTMDALITNVTSFVTAAVGWIGQVIGLVAEEPILQLMVVTMGVAGFAIGAFSRLTRIG